ncbi:MAG: FG-GAP repeat protein [Ignavibacteria bacterium]|nr:FG-GAP repeat protein [Ignavibacteria bacterium]
MKIKYSFTNFSYIGVNLLIFILSNSVLANWQKPEIKYPLSAEHSISQSSEKKRFLPNGVTDDWLNDLRDENGNRINPESDNGTSREIPEDPGDALQRKIFNGQGTNTNFGNSVSTAGDVNGDGYDDIIVGAFAYNFIQEGYIFITVD